jgi:hypothetical protein
MSPDLEEFVEAEGGGWQYPLDVDAFRWKRVARYPTKRFLERPIRGRAKPETKEDWKRWLATEIANADDPDYYRQLEHEWLSDPSAFSEIIVAELPDGTIDVGDGWHRLAMSIVHERTTVPAVVGRPRKSKRQLDTEIAEALAKERP